MSIHSAKREISVGSISRDDAARRFPFLAHGYPGRRSAIKDFTHRDPDFVFWVYPDGRLLDARDSHRRNPPPGYGHILKDEPDYGGFLRGRIASFGREQLIVVYCRQDALLDAGRKMDQLLAAVQELPVPLRDDALVISDNGDLYGTLADILDRSHS